MRDLQSYQTNVIKICTKNEYQSPFSIPETLMLNKMAQDIREALEDRHGTGLAEHMGTVGTYLTNFWLQKSTQYRDFLKTPFRLETYKDWLLTI